MTIYFYDRSVDNNTEQVSIDSAVAFVSYARFTVSYCSIGHYVAVPDVDI